MTLRFAIAWSYNQACRIAMKHGPLRNPPSERREYVPMAKWDERFMFLAGAVYFPAKALHTTIERGHWPMAVSPPWLDSLTVGSSVAWIGFLITAPGSRLGAALSRVSRHGSLSREKGNAMTNKPQGQNPSQPVNNDPGDANYNPEVQAVDSAQTTGVNVTDEAAQREEQRRQAEGAETRRNK